MATVRIDREYAYKSQGFVQENLRLLHAFSDSNRNAQRLALIVKELQVDVGFPMHPHVDWDPGVCTIVVSLS